jgi:hypothetical protein
MPGLPLFAFVVLLFWIGLRGSMWKLAEWLSKS